MMEEKIVNKLGLTFDDVLLLPNFSDFKREDIDVTTDLTNNLTLSLPLISAPMDTITTAKMAIALGKLGGLGVIHRNLSIEDQAAEVKKAKKEIPFVAAAVGVGKEVQARSDRLIKEGVDIIVIDSAHGFSKWVVDLTRFISQKYKNLILISGNVGTSAGAKALIEAGADVLRVGIGPGSICTTRIVAGVGIPQLTAIFETVALAKKYGVTVIADGGLRHSGDIVKALAAGTKSIMSGSLFAGCSETPGKIITKNGKKYKTYRGMGSITAMKEGSAARYGQQYRSGQEKKLVAEGVDGMVPYQGLLSDVVTQLVGGLKSGMYYVGAKNITELQEKSRFIKISQASLVESYPHDILIQEEASSVKR